MSIRLFKASNGANLLLGTFTNNRIDREGQILTDAAHKEYIQYLDEHPERAPNLILWHLDDTNLSDGNAKAWYYNAGFVSMIWELSEKSAEFIDNFDKLFNAGMSHGFNVLRFDEAGDIEQYRTFEASILPLDKAANIYTDINLIKEQNMTDEQLAKTLQAFGAKAAFEIAKKVNEAEIIANQLDQQGVAKKEFAEDEPVADEEPTEEPEGEASAVVDEAAVVAGLQALDGKIDQLLASQQAQIDTLNEQVATLSKQLNTSKNNARSRVSLLAFTEGLRNANPSVVGQEETQVDGRSTLAKSKPKQKSKNEASTFDRLQQLASEVN